MTLRRRRRRRRRSARGSSEIRRRPTRTMTTMVAKRKSARRKRRVRAAKTIRQPRAAKRFVRFLKSPNSNKPQKRLNRRSGNASSVSPSGRSYTTRYMTKSPKRSKSSSSWCWTLTRKPRNRCWRSTRRW
uniref:(northern house mosquito) hypothetical protein n=1 Tax=Culex pipiens TaxID=7175 RepID=A0A8D8FM32_CULPI